VLGLLVVSVTINYLDRGALSVAAPLLTRELELSAAQMGLLLSSFFWTYATFQLVAGWLVDRFPVKWVYAIGYLVWSLATAAVGIASGLPELLLARFVLGMGESVAYPACSKIIVTAFKESQRGTANALVDAGSKVGPGLSTMLGGLAIAAYGWRGLFVVLGLGSLVWLAPWLWAAPSAESSADTEIGPGWMALLGKSQVWAASLGMFTYGYSNYFLLTWLPSYLIKERGFSMAEMATIGSVPFWIMAVSSLFSGMLSDRFIRGGAAAGVVRLRFAVTGLLGCGAAILAAPAVGNPTHSLILLAVAGAFLGVYSSNCWAITQTLAGPLAAGRWTGFQNFIGNLGGVAAPLITGWIVTATGSFLMAFWVAGGLLGLGVVIYQFWLRRVEPVEW